MKEIIDLIGKRFGKLTVIEKSERKCASGSMYLCVCDCGNKVTIARCNLTSGHAKSCGCKRKEFLKNTPPGATHQFSRCNNGKPERLYYVWRGMRQRCNNPNNNRYDLYGKRGIVICDEWNDYKNFREWALSNGYDENAPRGKCTIDRIDPNGIYEPNNCRWVDSHIQNLNKRKVSKNE